MLDANFASRGKYQTQRLRKVIDRLVARGHEVIIPEVVVCDGLVLAAAPHAGAPID